MPAGEMIGNGGLMPLPTMGSPVPGGAPPMGMPPGRGLMPLPGGGAVTNGMPPAPFGSPPVDASVFGANTDASDYERQLRERAIQERNKQLQQQEEMRRRGQLMGPIPYRDPSTFRTPLGVNLDVRADDDGLESVKGGLQLNDGAQKLKVGGAYYPGYTQMDTGIQLPGIGRAEVEYQTPSFSFTGGYTPGRRGRGGFGGAANFRGQF